MCVRCSSVFAPSSLLGKSEARGVGQQACASFVAAHPPSEWLISDVPQTKARMTGLRHVDGCWECQNADMVTKTLSFPAMAMRDLMVRLDRPVKLFDIDAQGADFEIVRSVGPLMQKVESLKMECQDFDAGATPWYLYSSGLPNNCTAARAHLEGLGFEFVKQESNNCACREYNLFMHRPPGKR